MKAIVPQEPRHQRVLWGALSIVALALIVVAVPVGLYELGGIPVFHLDVGRAAKEISSHRADGTYLISHWLIRGALILAWISWAWMTMCVLLEIRSRLTGRTSARLPASRSVQSLVACLVGTTLAISSMGRVAVVPRASATPVASATQAGPATVKPLRVIDVLTPAGQPHQADERPGEIPSAGTGSRALAITAPTGGRVLPVDDCSLGSGPVGATTGFQQSRHGPYDVRSSEPSHVVAPRETLWSIARERLGSPLRWKEIAALNYDVIQRDGGTLTDEHWIRPGWMLQLPRSTDKQRSFPAGRPARIAGSFENVDQVIGHNSVPDELPVIEFLNPPRAAGPTDPFPDGGGLVRFRDPRVPLMPVGGGVVGAGVVGLLDRMRRVQQRYRNEGAYIRLPDPAQRHFEQRLRLGEGREIVHDVDLALRLLVQAWSHRGSDLPCVMGVTIRNESIDLLIDRTEGCESLPAPFRCDLARRSVAVDRASLPCVQPDESGVGRTVPAAPLLVTAGHGTDGVIMVNLESLGALSVDGDPSGCEGVVRALALELATSHWTGWFDLNVVGFGVELERFERVVSLSDVSMLLDRLYRRRLNNESLLREAGYGSFAQARCADYSTRWDPVVVICSPTIAEADASELLELASDPRLGLAVVASGTTPGAPHVLSLAGAHRTSNLEPLGSVLFPQQIEPQELDSVTTLVDTAMSRQSVLISEEPYVNLPVSMPTTMSVQTPAPDEDVVAEPPRRAGGVGRTRGRQPDQASDMHEVEVAVLGQIEIFGAAREFTRAWSKELVVYLAMHPNGASNEAWATALWPDRLMAPSSLHSTASVARRALGQARNGIDHLPRSHGRLALSGTVGTDWDRFLVHADANDTGRWRTALELVRGRPFEGLRSSDWPILEGIGPAIEASIVDLSGRLAGSCLAAGDARGAEWAARRGLLVSPYDERLYRMLMRAADAGGNPAGVEAVMSELIKLVANEIEPLDSVHPSTMDLYRSLTRRRNGTARLLDPTFHAT